MNDTQLLQSFLNGSESAFRTLVERHLPLVLGTARRIAGQNGLADDVAQTVFILLARKAKTFGSGIILSGWLYRTTCFVARRALCSEHRRQRRESEAAHMYDHHEYHSDWKEIAPELDTALTHLGETDRNALLLRFLNDQPLREVGVALGISEEAAKKRVSRALEKLRTVLHRRGKEVSIAALMAGLTREELQARDAGLSSQIAATAIATGTGTIAGSLLLTEVVTALQFAKIKLVAMGVTVVAMVSIIALSLVRNSEPADVSAAVGTNISKMDYLRRSRLSGKEETGGANEKSPLQMRVNPLRVTVLDATTSMPIPGTKVIHGLMIRSEKSPATPIMTDTNGQVSIDIPAAHPFDAEMNQFAVWLDANGYASRQIHWLCTTGHVLRTVSEEYTVGLSQGITLAGIVVDDDGRPLPHVKVKATGSNYRGFTTSSSNGKVTSPPELRAEDFASYSIINIETDSSGRFEFPDYPVDLPRLLIELTSPEGVNAKFRTVQGKQLSAEDVPEVAFADLKNGTARLVIPRGVTIEGSVVDTHGQPIPGANVLEGTQWGNLKVLSEVKTDSAGTFKLPNRPVREFILAASAEKHGSASVVVAVQPGIKPVRIELPPEQPLRVKVVDGSGNPQASASVRLVDYYNEGMGFLWSGETDVDGRCIWRAAPTNELTYSISTAVGSRIVRLRPSTNEHVVVLQQRNADVRVSLDISDADSKAPVQEFEAEISYSLLGDQPDGPFRTIKGTNGRVEFHLTHEDFHPGQRHSWLLQVKANDYQSAITRTYQRGEGDQDIKLELLPSAPVKGTVLTPTGKPAGSAYFGLAGIGESIFTSKPGELQQRAMPAQRTDKQGRFEINRELGMTSVVVFHESGWATVDLPRGKAELEVQLQPWSRIEGTVVVGGTPRIGETVRLKNLVFDLADPIMLFHDATTDEKGRFTFDRVPPGNYEIGISTEITKPDGTWDSTLQSAITIGVSETKTVILGSSGITVAGKLQMPNGLNGGASWTNAIAMLSRDVPIPKHPERGRFVTDASHRAAHLAFARDPDVIAQLAEARTYAGRISEDGTVQFEHVPAGRYILEVNLYNGRKSPDVISHAIRIVGYSRVAIVVPEQTNAGEDIISFGDLPLESF